MSRNELLDAYQSGKMSRRAFVRGMTALGVSIAAANHLADEVVASSKHVDDVYDHQHDHKHHHQHHHQQAETKPAVKTTVAVSQLPSTGAGDTASASGAMGTARVLGILGTSAAAAAALLRRWGRSKPETD